MKENLTSLAHNRGKRRFVRSLNAKSIAVPDSLIDANQPEQDSDNKNRDQVLIPIFSLWCRWFLVEGGRVTSG